MFSADIAKHQTTRGDPDFAVPNTCYGIVKPMVLPG